MQPYIVGWKARTILTDFANELKTELEYRPALFTEKELCPFLGTTIPCSVKCTLHPPSASPSRDWEEMRFLLQQVFQVTMKSLATVREATGSTSRGLAVGLSLEVPSACHVKSARELQKVLENSVQFIFGANFEIFA